MAQEKDLTGNEESLAQKVDDVIDNVEERVRRHEQPANPVPPTIDKRISPGLGVVLQYMLTQQDVNRIRNNRTAHQIDGNSAAIGQVFPAVVVAVFPGEFPSNPVSTYGVNLQVFLDGPDTLWVTSAPANESAGKLPQNGAWFL